MAERKRFFHWFLEFPEIMERGGFDCILGNPPYLGNRALSGTYGDAFLAWVKYAFSPAGSVDLVVYFFRRIYELIKPTGVMALISTNTLAQGVAREGGLDFVIGVGGTIIFAVRSTKWPGRAAVEVSLVALTKGEWQRSRILDGKPVQQITAYLDSAEQSLNPVPLNENADKSFIGSYVLGTGFILDSNEARHLLTTEQSLAKVILPYLNGSDLNSRPDQTASRWIINFFDWPEEKCASEYPTAFSLIEDRVKPERTRQDENGDFVLRKPLPQKWWIYADKRPKLYASIANLKRVLVIAQVSRTVAFAFVSTKQVLDSKLVVFPFEDARYFSVLQSAFHYHWAWRYCTTMKTDLSYAPSAIFSPFPMPQFDAENVDRLDEIGEHLHSFRSRQMECLGIGLTDLYNIMHSRDLTPAEVARVSKKPPSEAEAGYQGILELRRLHRELDLAIRDAYGWTNLDLGHDFHEVETLPENDRIRYTISPAARKEVLKRLLDENHKRAVLQAQAADATAKSIAKRGRKAKSADDTHGDLFA
jgi:hypothetical protein